METSFLEEIVTNQSLRQGYSLSPVLFNLYTDELISFWKNKSTFGIGVNSHMCLNTILYTNDQITIHQSESDVQSSVCFHGKLAFEYNLKIPVVKT